MSEEDYLKNLKNGAILVFDGKETKEYKLDEDGQHKGRIPMPDNCRVTALTANDLVFYEGRVRGDKFVLAKRFRNALGKEIDI